MNHPLKAMFRSAFEAGAASSAAPGIGTLDDGEAGSAFEAWCEAYLGVPSVLDSVALDRLGYEWRQAEHLGKFAHPGDLAMLDLVGDLLAATGRIKP